jgi:hypothetical protein
LHDQQELIVMEPTAIEAQTRGEIDIQISTAKSYPRSIKRFKQTALTMATIDEETAASMFYRLPRGGKSIEGPSARLAEIVSGAWGNLRAEARVIETGKSHITARGMAWDLETNVATSVEVRRRITNRAGKRFDEDMIGVTANAACSIALRNAVFKVVPMAYVKEIFAKAKAIAIGDGSTLDDRREKMIAAFGAMGVETKSILAFLEVEGIEDIGLKHLEDLIGIHTAIADGDLSPSEAFKVQPAKKEAVKAKVKVAKETDGKEAPGELLPGVE